MARSSGIPIFTMRRELNRRTSPDGNQKQDDQPQMRLIPYHQGGRDHGG
ncbi:MULTISPECIES: hypothetical protein [Bacillaceae]